MSDANEIKHSLENGVVYCDGAFNKHTKPYAWASVVGCNDKDLIARYLELCSDAKYKEDSFKIEERVLGPKVKFVKRYVAIVKFEGVVQNNNGAELIGMLIALRLCTIDNSIKTIC